MDKLNVAAEREALVALYHATNGPDWERSTGWMSDRPLDDWFGVDVDSEGSVIALILPNTSLSGPIPPELGNLVNLKKLGLSIDPFSGSMPPELVNLPNLEQLSFGANPRIGPIP